MARQPTYTSALRNALTALDPAPTDGAAVRLAYGYAKALDDPTTDVHKVGPLFLAALDSLGLTPKGRVAITGQKETERGSDTTSPLDELRAKRHARAHRAAAVDTTPP